MKTLIAYGSKHGAAKKCAQMLKQKIAGEVEIVDLKQTKDCNLKQYDQVIVGGSIYAGMIQKEVTAFCTQNLEILGQKKLGLFICCMSENDADKQLEKVFPPELLKTAIIKKSCGGAFDFKQMNVMEKMIIKMVSKAQAKNDPNTKPVNTKESVSMLNIENINAIAEAMRGY